MEESSIFTQVSLVLGVAAVISIIMRLLKQPLIMGYIITGIVVGPSLLNLVQAKDAFESFSEIGITLLLFVIGLGLNAGVIRSLGRVSIVTASILLFAVGLAGYGTSLLLGFNQQTAVILGLALFFSSTIIILKVLSDNKELSRLYGQIAIGVILVDDVVATLALVAVSAVGSNEAFSLATVGILVLKAILIAGALGFLAPMSCRGLASCLLARKSSCFCLVSPGDSSWPQDFMRSVSHTKSGHCLPVSAWQAYLTPPKWPPSSSRCATSLS